MSFLETAASIGGFSGFFAAIMFIIYRHDRKCSEEKLREDRNFSEKRLTELLEADRKSREENTRALTALVTVIERISNPRI